MNPARSTSAGEPPPRMVTARFEVHAKGEIFTLDITPRSGPATTSSTILFLDGKEREFAPCSGTQSSRRLDPGTIEIVYKCKDSWTRLHRRLSAQPNELILDITEKRSGGRHVERHLILEKQ